MAVAILAPVLERPARVMPFFNSVLDGAPPETDIELVFVASPGDRAEREALEILEARGAHVLVATWDPGPGDYARKINHAALQAAGLGVEWLLLGADDLKFHAGWLPAALAVAAATKACVIGTNDLGNSRVTAGMHSTHPLVHIDYLECGTIDEPGKLLHEGYHHNFCDTEFVETAMHRGTWAFAEASHVEHLHHLWGKAPNDEVYEVGARTFATDQLVYQRRRVLWNWGSS